MLDSALHRTYVPVFSCTMGGKQGTQFREGGGGVRQP